MNQPNNAKATIRLATSDDRVAVVGVVVAAFVNDPAFRFFFVDDDEYVAQAPSFVGALFDHRIAHGGTWVLTEHDEADPLGVPAIVSVALWAPPSAPAHGADMSALSPAARERLRRYDEATRDGLPTGPLWYLGILATHPDHWGRRHGRSVMVPGLAAAGRDRCHAYLETTNPENVAMYARSGWSTVAVNRVDDLTVTVMATAATSAIES